VRQVRRCRIVAASAGGFGFGAVADLAGGDVQLGHPDLPEFRSCGEISGPACSDGAQASRTVPDEQLNADGCLGIRLATDGVTFFYSPEHDREHGQWPVGLSVGTERPAARDCVVARRGFGAGGECHCTFGVWSP
jgi:hypothetical protein